MHVDLEVVLFFSAVSPQRPPRRTVTLMVGAMEKQVSERRGSKTRWILVSCREENVPREVFDGKDGCRLSILSLHMAGQGGKSHGRKAQRDGPAPCPLCSAGEQQQRDVNRVIVHPEPCSCMCNLWIRFA